MKIITMGPQGSCHENALQHYLIYHGVQDCQTLLTTDLVQGIDRVYAGEADFLLQCSAHLSVHLVTEKYYTELRIVDTFIYPTKEIVLLESNEVDVPRTLGFVKPTEGYFTESEIEYPEIVYEPSKPLVGEGLLQGKYHAGVTTMEYYRNHPGRFRIKKHIGSVVTTWILYGRMPVGTGEVIGAMPRGFLKAQR